MSFLSHLAFWRRPTTGGYTPTVSQPLWERPDPEPSCLVKGVVKSLEVETDEWRIPFLLDDTFVIEGRHSNGTVFTVLAEPDRGGDLTYWGTIDGNPVGPTEARLIYEAVHRHVLAPRKAAAQALVDARLGHFTVLGCPESVRDHA